MQSYWAKNFACDSLWIVVVEQNDKKPFNRASLANVGISEVTHRAKRLHLTVGCIVFHDVDLVPEPGVPYTQCAVPTQLGSELQHFQWGVPYAKSAGGIVSMNLVDWRKVNGFSNRFQGWGGEDDDLYNRLAAAKLLKNGQITRPPTGHGRFKTIDERRIHHPRRRDHPNHASNVQILNDWSKHPNAWRKEGLNTLVYDVDKARTIGNTTHLWVTLLTPK